MKSILRLSFFLGICILLIACEQSGTPTAGPASSFAVTITASITPLPSETVSATRTPTDVPRLVPPTMIPTLDPTIVPALLREALSIETLDGVNGHNIQRITGWDYGFRQDPCAGYQWLDARHLLLYPRTGEWINIHRDGGGREDVVTQTIVINLETGTTWLPPYQPGMEGGCDLPQWSREQGFMVFSTMEPGYQTQQEAVSIRTLDGAIVKSYWGKLIDVSPSGTKILIDDDTWIDLATGEVVDFAWYKYEESAPDEFVFVSPPIWSSDETQVLICCYFYGNARTGKTNDWKDYNVYGGTWVKNDKYLLLQYDTYWGADPGFVPLYDPATNITLNLNELAGLSTDLQCPETNVSPNREYVWVMCYDTDYLVDLSNFQSNAYPGYTQVDINWSANGKFAWIDNFDPGRDSGLKVLSITSKTLSPLPVSPTSGLAWHPTDNLLAYLTENNQVLTILNVENMTIKGWKLPTTGFGDAIWSPDGNHIALAARDGSLWQIDYPKMENFEQLTEPMPVRDILWSPDSKYIAFINGPDIYTVEISK